MKPFSWECPHCERAVTITESDYSESEHSRRLDNFEVITATSIFIKCPHPECSKVSLRISTYYWSELDGQQNSSEPKTWNLIPRSKARIFPDYVPAPIREDYEEACLIADLSPKASATLSRRCLQGMIRDFWGESKSTLDLEIKAIKEKLDEETHAAIDSVRSIGNIGAHMEKDINVILDVEPHEAGLLIQLIEMLITEWYVAREERKKRMSSIVGLAAAKKEIKEQAKAVQG